MSHGPQVTELTEQTSVRGTIPEANQDAMTFQVKLIDGRKVRAPIPTLHLQSILQAFNGYKHGVRVLLQGVGRFDRQERLQGFESIEHVSILDPLDVAARLDELRTLHDGWLDGKGVAPSQAGLDWLAHSFEQCFPDDLPLPYIYPTAEGGVQAEWSLPPDEITLEIDLADHTGEWHALDMQTDVEESRDLSLDAAQEWAWLADRIRRLSGETA